MKRIAFLLAALLMFSLTGCGSSEAAGKASDSDKAGAYEVIPPEDGRGDLIPASSDVVSIPVLVGGGLPFTSMENLMNENYEDGTYTYEDMTQDGSVLVVDMAFQSLRTNETAEEYAEYAAQFAALDMKKHRISSVWNTNQKQNWTMRNISKSITMIRM